MLRNLLSCRSDAHKPVPYLTNFHHGIVSCQSLLLTHQLPIYSRKRDLSSFNLSTCRSSTKSQEVQDLYRKFQHVIRGRGNQSKAKDELHEKAIEQYKKRYAHSRALTERHTFLAIRFLPMLRDEQDFLEQKVNDRLGTWSVSQLKRAGYCLTGMSACWLIRKQVDRSIARFTFSSGVEPQKHVFK